MDSFREQQRGMTEIEDPTDSSSPAIDAEKERALETLLTTVNDLSKSVDQIQKCTEGIYQKHCVLLATYDNSAAKQETERLMGVVKNLSHKVHLGLKDMKQSLEQTQVGAMSETDLRVVNAQYVTLSYRFSEVMTSYNEIQEEYREKNKERIQRQLHCAGKEVESEELDVMIESNDTTALTEGLLGTVNVQGEVESRYQAILDLEQNINELRDMFGDLAMLVNEQSDTINRISTYIDGAADYVATSEQKLR
eukprot:Em0015g450a